MLCLAIGLTALGFFAARRHHRRRWGGWHGHHHGHHGHHHRGGAYFVMRTLDTSPGQEKAIREEVDALRDRARLAKDELHAARADLAEVVRDEAFDRARFEAALGRVDAAWATMKSQLGDSVGRVHATLDARQRDRLADLLATRRGRSFGPFR